MGDILYHLTSKDTYLDTTHLLDNSSLAATNRIGVKFVIIVIKLVILFMIAQLLDAINVRKGPYL